jgi:membrane protein DedA with SNARE-associated domain
LQLSTRVFLAADKVNRLTQGLFERYSCFDRGPRTAVQPMEQTFFDIISTSGIYAVFGLCMVEGDLTLLTSGVLAHEGFFGSYSFGKVFIAGMLGGVAGDSFGYLVGRVFRRTVRDYRFYKMAQPRIERLIAKFGGAAVILSKYIYGIRVAMCISSGVARMPYVRFLYLDTISCSIWAFLLAGAGYFFSGAVTNIIGDFHQIGIVLFVIVVVGVIGFYLLETLWLSKKVEQVAPETVHMIGEKIHDIEEAAQGKLHDLGERLHLTQPANREVGSDESESAIPADGKLKDNAGEVKIVAEDKSRSAAK